MANTDLLQFLCLSVTVFEKMFCSRWATVGSPSISGALVSPPALRVAQARRAYVLLMFYFIFYIFSDFCQTNYLNIYPSDVHKIHKIGRTLAEMND